MRAELFLDAHAQVGEGPAWDAIDQRLIWVDITAGMVHELRSRPEGFVTASWSVGQHVGAAVPRRREGAPGVRAGLLLAVADGFVALGDDGSLDRVAWVEDDIPANRMNDGKCDPQGRLWAGTMPYNAGERLGALYRLDPGGRVVRALEGVGLSNGMGWSPDGGTFYFIDSPTQGVDAFDFDPIGGTLSHRRRLITVDPADGMPDGMTVDGEGNLWVCLWGGGAVRCYRADGTLDGVVQVPVSQVTSCAFGGRAGDELFVTTASLGLDRDALERQPHAGGLFRCRPGVSGPPASGFAG